MGEGWIQLIVMGFILGAAFIGALTVSVIRLEGRVDKLESRCPDQEGGA